MNKYIESPNSHDEFCFQGEQPEKKVSQRVTTARFSCLLLNKDWQTQ